MLIYKRAMLEFLQETLLYVEKQNEWIVHMKSVIAEKEKNSKKIHQKICNKIIEELENKKPDDQYNENFKVKEEIELINHQSVPSPQLHNRDLEMISQQQLYGENVLKTFSEGSKFISSEHQVSKKRMVITECCSENVDQVPNLNDSIFVKTLNYATNNTAKSSDHTVHKENYSEECVPETDGNDDNKESNLKSSVLQPPHKSSTKSSSKGSFCYKQLKIKSACASKSTLCNGVKLQACLDSCKKCPLKSLSISYNSNRTVQKRFLCVLCNKQFTRLRSLKIHNRVHTGEKPFVCELCKKQFASSSNLTVHKRVHTGEKPYACVLCNKRFSNRSSFNRHKRIHTGEKPFACVLCNKQFTQLKNLTIHKRVHTGVKPYACVLCKKQFGYRSTLTRHKRVHTGEKPFACVICNKKFARNSNLIVHKRVHCK